MRHRARPLHAGGEPVHVVLRSRFQPLRSQLVFGTVRLALARATRGRAGFRVIHFSVQRDHLHLLVEARDKVALSRGMQGLAIRVAKRLNALLRRRGKVWADRFFARALTSPSAVRNALAYVLNNFRKHLSGHLPSIDPYSSAPYFSGFRELRGFAPRALAPAPALPLSPRGVPPPEKDEEIPIARARTWLASVGWRRAGTIGFQRAPRASDDVSD